MEMIIILLMRIVKNSRKRCTCISFYCIGKIDFFFVISVFLTIFPYTTRLIYLRPCISAKRNAHVCVESSAFANAHLSYYNIIVKQRIKLNHKLKNKTPCNMYISQIFLFLGVAYLLMIKRKINFSFNRRKVAPIRTRLKARLVAYASLQKFSKYTYYMGLSLNFL